MTGQYVTPAPARTTYHFANVAELAQALQMRADECNREATRIKKIHNRPAKDWQALAADAKVWEQAARMVAASTVKA